MITASQQIETISFWDMVAALLVLSGLMRALMYFGALAHLTKLAEGLTPFGAGPISLDAFLWKNKGSSAQ